MYERNVRILDVVVRLLPPDEKEKERERERHEEGRREGAGGRPTGAGNPSSARDEEEKS